MDAQMDAAAYYEGISDGGARDSRPLPCQLFESNRSPPPRRGTNTVQVAVVERTNQETLQGFVNACKENGAKVYTDEQRSLVASMTEEEMVKMLVAMRKKADERAWIWEDIEELAEQGYCRDLAANRGRGLMFGE